MTIQLAEQWIRDYQKVLSDDTKRGSRRDPRLLPVPKEKLLQAIKLQLAQLFFFNSHTNEDLTKPLIKAAMFLDSFSDLPTGATEFIESMHRRRREIDSFCMELLKLQRSDQFYWQRVYAMLGINSETKTTSFFEGMKQRLRSGFKSSAAQEEQFASRDPEERITLD
ncbi:MAG: hypothetical protein DME24_14640 [Verrucomicrobia bacterium]|nr:MAG: hypothetical protein DME24_14640 [Verrucomicrobiota bacterium]